MTPTAPAAVTLRNERRSTVCFMSGSPCILFRGFLHRLCRKVLRHRGGGVDGLTNADIGATAAEVAVHGRIDVGIRRVGFLCEQRRGGHDLTGLAIAALG